MAVDRVADSTAEARRSPAQGGHAAELLSKVVDCLSQGADFFDSVFEFGSCQYIRNSFQAIKLLNAPFGTPSRRAGKQRTTSNEPRHMGQVLNLLTSHCNRAFVATNLFIHKEAERNYQPQRSKRTQRSGQVIKCSSCLCVVVVKRVLCSQGGSRGRLGEQRPTSNEQRAVIPGTRGQVLKILSNTAYTDQC